MDRDRSDYASHLPPAPLRSPTGPGRLYPADVVAGVRALVKGAGLSYREAAARSGLREDTVGRWARRFGWRRAGVACEAGARGAAFPSCDSRRRHAEERPQVASRSTRNRGASFETPAAQAPQDDAVRSFRSASAEGTPRRPYHCGPALHEAARVRFEGTRVGTERIAGELGVGRATLCRWAKRFGWRRPAPPDRAGPTFYRSRGLGRAYGADAVGTARALVTGSDLPFRRIAARAGVSPSTVSEWTRRRGWARPPARPRTQRAAAERRAAAIVAAGGPSRRAYPPAVVAAARELYETTGWSTALVAARAGATRERVASWARRGGWTRARDRADPHGRARRRRSRRGAGESGRSAVSPA